MCCKFLHCSFKHVLTISVTLFFLYSLSCIHSSGFVSYSRVARSLLAWGAFLTRVSTSFNTESPNRRHVNTFYFIFISSTAMIFLKTKAFKENKYIMFLNTTLYLLRHETVKSQGNKSGRNRQPVKICFRQSHTNSQQNKCITLFGILKLLCATRVKLFV